MATKKDPRLNEPLQGDGPGAYLRKAREEAGISIEKVASSLLLHSATVRALEADAYERLPAPTFVRGYFRGYARVLGLPSKPVLEMYDRQGFEPPPLATDATGPEQAHTSDTAVRLVTYAVAVVLALLVGLWWHSQEGGGFGIAGDLFDRSPESDQDPSALATGESGTTPDEGEARGESVALLSGPADELPQDEGTPFPPPVGDAESGAPAPLQPGASPGDVPAAESESAGVATRLQPDASPGDGRSAVTAPVTEAAPGEIVEVESTPSGTEAEGESVAAAPLAPGTTPGDEGSADAAPVEGAVSGNIAEAGSAPSEPSAPEAAANREASASQEPQSGTVAGLDRTTDTVPVSGTSPAGADGEGADDASAASPNASLPAQPAPETAAATTDTDRDPGATTGEAGLVLEFVHESWVEVYDRERTRLFFGLVQPGRVLGFDGPQPFDVLLGFGKDVRVSIDGRAFDHTPFLRHGVARFSVGTGPDDGTDVAETAATSEPDADDTPAPESEPEVRGG